MVTRVFIWKCSNCNIGVQKRDYGLPTGWVYKTPNVLDKEKEIKHYCNNCKGGFKYDTVRS